MYSKTCSSDCKFLAITHIVLSPRHFFPQAVAHNLYTPPGPGPAAVGGMSSQNTMYSTGGEYLCVTILDVFVIVVRNIYLQ